MVHYAPDAVHFQKLISQTFKEDRLIHKDSCLIRQLAYVDVKVIYISVRIQNNDGHFA